MITEKHQNSSGTDSAAALSIRKSRVLVIDDEPGLRNMLGNHFIGRVIFRVELLRFCRRLLNELRSCAARFQVR